jgi:hypothetical protein
VESTISPSAEVPVCDGAPVDWAAFDLVGVNHTWGYVTRRERFLA